MNDYFIIERTKPDMKEYLSSIDTSGAMGWRPTPQNAYQFPNAILAESQRLELLESKPQYKYQLFQVRMNIFPVDVTVKPQATQRGGGSM